MFTVLLFLTAVFLAYSNGANDNFKGVATLYGSGTTDYKSALLWATVTTLAGSLMAVYFSSELVRTFSGKGLVPDALVGSFPFLIAVAAGAAGTIYLATMTGYPISTTHSLTGALIGAGLASGYAVSLAKLWSAFFYPLLLAPVLSLLLTLLVYPLFRGGRRMMRVESETCLCINDRDEAVVMQPDGTAVLRSTGMTLSLDQVSVCRTRYKGSVVGVSAESALNAMHYLTAGAVSFARGLNDTPKIVALLVAANMMALDGAMAMVGLGMATGGLLNARRVAETMSRKITRMNHEQGFTANLVTAFLVIFASRWGMPVSTTHVSCGSLFGIGLANHKANWGVIRNILLSWVITLPAAALLSALVYTIAS